MKTSERILIFIGEFTAENGYAPSVRQIAEGVGLKSTSTVQGHIERLAEKGLLVKDDRKARTAQPTSVVSTITLNGEIPTRIMWEGREYVLAIDPEQE